MHSREYIPQAAQITAAPAHEPRTPSARQAGPTAVAPAVPAGPLLFGLPHGLQAKLAVSQPGDADERQADHLADQVLRSPAPTAGRCACGGMIESGGECAACHRKRVSAKPSGPSGLPTAAPPSVGRALRSPGQPLQAHVRSYMEPRFGADFSAVRVQTSQAAAQSAQEINALAYTAGNQIVFAPGQYQPESLAGRRLLAHELAHVLQQSGQTPIIQRQTPPTANDFTIRGKINRPGDADNLFFDRNSATLDSTEQTKISTIISTHGAATNLTLNGFRSEDEPASLANTRNTAVETALLSSTGHAPHTGARAKISMAASTVGNIDYREVRKVEVLPTPSGRTSAPSAMPSSCATSVVTCPTNAFTLAQPEAERLTTGAINALTAATLAASAGQPTRLLLRELFGGTNTNAATRLATGISHAPTIRTKLIALRSHIRNMTTQHVCHNLCDGGCGDRPAYNTGQGSAAIMTLCPAFFAPGNTLRSRAETLIHEGAHGTTGLGARDLAYRAQRLVGFLTDTQALVNTDSFVLLVLLIDTPGSVPIGPPAAQADPVTGTTNAGEQRLAREAITFLEQWMLLADFDTQILYDTVNRSIAPAPGWASALGDAFNRETMQRLAPLFGLTVPGASAPFTQPTAADRGRLASIHERYLQMRRATYARPVTLNKVAAGSGGWAAGPGAPGSGAGNSVDLPITFFGLPNANQRVRALLALLVASIPDISATLEPAYVDAADQIRQHRGVGP